MDSRILVFYSLLCFAFIKAATVGEYNNFGISHTNDDCIHNDTYLFNGECKILPDWKSCASDEWLVLDKLGAFRTPKCMKRPCKNDDEVWWPDIEQCENINNIKICEEGFTNITIDPYGEGACIGNQAFGDFHQTFSGFNNCFNEGTYSFNGECKFLPDKESCASDEWLVLDKCGDRMKPICKKRPCKSDDEVWWREINRCENIANIQICGKGFINVTINEYGEGVCICDGLYGTLENHVGCHELYQRGPCAENEVVTLGYRYAICSKDRCLKENDNLKNDGRKCFAPVYGKGKCVKLGDKKICEFIGPNSIYQIDPEQRIPTCSNRTLDWRDYEFPLVFQNDFGNDAYICTNWIEESLETRKCYCKRDKLLKCTGMFVTSAVAGSINNCPVHDSKCRESIKIDSHKMFVGDSMKIVNRKKPTNH